MEDLLERTRQLRGLVHSARDETEQKRCLAASVKQALVDAGLFRLAVPAVHGGVEAPPVEALLVFEELASVEASAAWIVWNNTLPALLSKFLDAPAGRELFADARTLMANSTRPSGRARPSRDGFCVAGRWSLVSGCELASHVLVRCVLPEQGDVASRQPQFFMAYLPRARCQIVDTWHAGGLRGTGSHDVLIEDVFVPAAHCVAFGRPRQLDTPLYRMPFAATLSAGCAAVCLGIARAALEALIELALHKVSVDSGAPVREQSSLQVEIADLTTQRAAARRWLHDAIDEAWRCCSAGRPPTLQETAQLWGAARHAAEVSRRVVRRAYAAGGASSLYTQCPLERAHRDIHAATQHIILGQSWTQDAGRVLLGQQPVHPLFAA
jgi:alkylation response protein AidB-like acyl-CoA dehydrogenase